MYRNLTGDYEREFSPSQNFKWQNTDTLPAGEITVVSWESYNTLSQKYLPFNFNRIVNNGESDIWFYPNQDTENAILIPSGTIITMDGRAVPALASFKIENAGTTTISADKIIVTSSRQGQDADSVVERLHKRLYQKKSGWVV